MTNTTLPALPNTEHRNGAFQDRRAHNACVRRTLGRRPLKRVFSTPGTNKREAVAGALLLAVSGGLLFGLADAPVPHEVEMAGYATSLRGRTVSQRHNARRAAEALDGKTIAPGAVFSFNACVRSWSQDQGFVKAPVSYDGELIKAYGGGVCQTSTTLYNAALLAGLPIIERHAHVFAPHYVPPGQDAAVAQRNIDLRFRNPYAWPLHLHAGAVGDHLEVRIRGAKPVPGRVQITTETLSESAPARLTRVVYRPAAAAGRAYIRNPGAIGYRVLAFRSFLPELPPTDAKTEQKRRHERLSDDTYQAMDRIVQLNEPMPTVGGSGGNARAMTKNARQALACRAFFLS